ncbi:MAG: methionine--tRNA ligase subunit beta [Candidatus Sungbacteria bacterium]|nr:methionine--tRNA ligase subunit beta [Candidatus Sungbacteria bacterium]
MITFDEFKKLELRVAKITDAQRVAESEKLLQLTITLGREERTIVAGIGNRYAPEALAGKSIVIIANLEPRLLMGIESHGMLLAANSDTGPVLLQPESDVLPGTEVK